MKFKIVIVGGWFWACWLPPVLRRQLPSPRPCLPRPTRPGSEFEANGKMHVGTSGDYRPFEYYNEQFLLDGFDVALIKAIGQKIGVPAEVTDFAFDGLAPALQIGQIDAAIAAISVTDERQLAVDFSNIYYIGAGVALAKQGAGIGPLTSVDQLAQYRVGVQDASVYQTELLDLVEFARMPPTNVFAYVKADEGITAVKDGAIDLFLMDDTPRRRLSRSAALRSPAPGSPSSAMPSPCPKDRRPSGRGQPGAGRPDE